MLGVLAPSFSDQEELRQKLDELIRKTGYLPNAYIDVQQHHVMTKSGVQPVAGTFDVRVAASQEAFARGELYYAPVKQGPRGTVITNDRELYLGSTLPVYESSGVTALPGQKPFVWGMEQWAARVSAAIEEHESKTNPYEKRTVAHELWKINQEGLYNQKYQLAPNTTVVDRTNPVQTDFLAALLNIPVIGDKEKALGKFSRQVEQYGGNDKWWGGLAGGAIWKESEEIGTKFMPPIAIGSPVKVPTTTKDASGKENITWDYLRDPSGRPVVRGFTSEFWKAYLTSGGRREVNAPVVVSRQGVTTLESLAPKSFGQSQVSLAGEETTKGIFGQGMYTVSELPWMSGQGLVNLPQDVRDVMGKGSQLAASIESRQRYTLEGVKTVNDLLTPSGESRIRIFGKTNRPIDMLSPYAYGGFFTGTVENQKLGQYNEFVNKPASKDYADPLSFTTGARYASFEGASLIVPESWARTDAEKQALQQRLAPIFAAGIQSVEYDAGVDRIQVQANIRQYEGASWKNLTKMTVSPMPAGTNFALSNVAGAPAGTQLPYNVLAHAKNPYQITYYAMQGMAHQGKLTDFLSYLFPEYSRENVEAYMAGARQMKANGEFGPLSLTGLSSNLIGKQDPYGLLEEIERRALRPDVQLVDAQGNINQEFAAQQAEQIKQFGFGRAYGETPVDWYTKSTMDQLLAFQANSLIRANPEAYKDMSEQAAIANAMKALETRQRFVHLGKGRYEQRVMTEAITAPTIMNAVMEASGQGSDRGVFEQALRAQMLFQEANWFAENKPFMLRSSPQQAALKDVLGTYAESMQGSFTPSKYLSVGKDQPVELDTFENILSESFNAADKTDLEKLQLFRDQLRKISPEGADLRLLFPRQGVALASPESFINLTKEESILDASGNVRQEEITANARRYINYVRSLFQAELSGGQIPGRMQGDILRFHRYLNGTDPIDTKDVSKLHGGVFGRYSGSGLLEPGQIYLSEQALRQNYIAQGLDPRDRKLYGRYLKSLMNSSAMVVRQPDPAPPYANPVGGGAERIPGSTNLMQVITPWTKYNGQPLGRELTSAFREMGILSQPMVASPLLMSPQGDLDADMLTALVMGFGYEKNGRTEFASYTQSLAEQGVSPAQYFKGVVETLTPENQMKLFDQMYAGMDRSAALKFNPLANATVNFFKGVFGKDAESILEKKMMENISAGDEKTAGMGYNITERWNPAKGFAMGTLYNTYRRRIQASGTMLGAPEGFVNRAISGLASYYQQAIDMSDVKTPFSEILRSAGFYRYENDLTGKVNFAYNLNNKWYGADYWDPKQLSETAPNFLIRSLMSGVLRSPGMDIASAVDLFMNIDQRPPLDPSKSVDENQYMWETELAERRAMMTEAIAGTKNLETGEYNLSELTNRLMTFQNSKWIGTNSIAFTSMMAAAAERLESNPENFARVQAAGPLQVGAWKGSAQELVQKYSGTRLLFDYLRGKSNEGKETAFLDKDRLVQFMFEANQLGIANHPLVRDLVNTWGPPLGLNIDTAGQLNVADPMDASKVIPILKQADINTYRSRLQEAATKRASEYWTVPQAGGRLSASSIGNEAYIARQLAQPGANPSDVLLRYDRYGNAPMAGLMYALNSPMLRSMGMRDLGSPQALKGIFTPGALPVQRGSAAEAAAVKAMALKGTPDEFSGYSHFGQIGAGEEIPRYRLEGQAGSFDVASMFDFLKFSETSSGGFSIEVMDWKNLADYKGEQDILGAEDYPTQLAVYMKSWGRPWGELTPMQQKIIQRINPQAAERWSRNPTEAPESVTGGWFVSRHQTIEEANAFAQNPDWNSITRVMMPQTMYNQLSDTETLAKTAGSAMQMGRAFSKHSAVWYRKQAREFINANKKEFGGVQIPPPTGALAQAEQEASDYFNTLPLPGENGQQYWPTIGGKDYAGIAEIYQQLGIAIQSMGISGEGAGATPPEIEQLAKQASGGRGTGGTGDDGTVGNMGALMGALGGNIGPILVQLVEAQMQPLMGLVGEIVGRLSEMNEGITGMNKTRMNFVGRRVGGLTAAAARSILFGSVGSNTGSLSTIGSIENGAYAPGEMAGYVSKLGERLANLKWPDMPDPEQQARLENLKTLGGNEALEWAYGIARTVPGFGAEGLDKLIGKSPEMRQFVGFHRRQKALVELARKGWSQIPDDQKTDEELMQLRYILQEPGVDVTPEGIALGQPFAIAEVLGKTMDKTGGSKKIKASTLANLLVNEKEIRMYQAAMENRSPYEQQLLQREYSIAGAREKLVGASMSRQMLEEVAIEEMSPTADIVSVMRGTRGGLTRQLQTGMRWLAANQDNYDSASLKDMMDILQARKAEVGAAAGFRDITRPTRQEDLDLLRKEGQIRAENISVAADYLKKLEDVNTSERKRNQLYKEWGDTVGKTTELEYDLAKSRHDVLTSDLAKQIKMPAAQFGIKEAQAMIDSKSPVARAAGMQWMESMQGLQNLEAKMFKETDQESPAAMEGRLARRMLGGFGLMYLRNISDLVLQGMGPGYGQALEYQVGSSRGLGGAFAGTAPAFNPEDFLKGRQAMMGGGGFAQYRRFLGSLYQNEPGLMSLAGAAQSGVGVFGATAWLSSLLPAGSALGGALGAAAGPLGLLAATGAYGAAVYGATQDITGTSVGLVARELSRGPGAPAGIFDRLSPQSYAYRTNPEVFETTNELRQFMAAQNMGLPYGKLTTGEVTKYSVLAGQARAMQYSQFFDQQAVYDTEKMLAKYNITGIQSEPVIKDWKTVEQRDQYGYLHTVQQPVYQKLEDTQYARLLAMTQQGIPLAQVAEALAWTPGTTRDNKWYKTIEDYIKGQTQNQTLTVQDAERKLRGFERYQGLGMAADQLFPGLPSSSYLGVLSRMSEQQYGAFRASTAYWTTEAQYGRNLPVPDYKNFTGMDFSQAMQSQAMIESLSIQNQYANQYYNMLNLRDQPKTDAALKALQDRRTSFLGMGYAEQQEKIRETDIGMRLQSSLEAYNWGVSGTQGAIYGNRLESQSPYIQQLVLSASQRDINAIGMLQAYGLNNLLPQGGIGLTDIYQSGLMAGLPSGKPWGTTSLQGLGLTGVQMANKLFAGTSAMTTQIAGQTIAGIAGSGIAVPGMTTATGQPLVLTGMEGLQYAQQMLSYGYQQTQLGLQQSQLNLQRQYQPQFWNMQQQSMQLGWNQQAWSLDMQQRQMDMQNRQWQQNFSLNQQQALMQRGWTRQDWAYQDTTRERQWAWRQEDFQEEARFMTGRQRRLAERQMQRDTVTYNAEGQQIDKQRARQEELWKLEDERFALQKSQYTEQRKLQEESLQKQREFFEERKKLEQAQFDLQKQYQQDQWALQQQSIDAQKEYMENQKVLSDSMLALSKNMEQIPTILTLISQGVLGLATGAGAAIAGLFMNIQNMASNIVIAGGMGGGTGGASGSGYQSPSQVAAQIVQQWQAGTNYWMNQNQPPTRPQRIQRKRGRAFGGDVEAGQVYDVEEYWPEAFIPDQSGKVLPLHKFDPWQTEIINHSGSNSGSQPITIVINLGNERLGKYVIDAVDQELKI